MSKKSFLTICEIPVGGYVRNKFYDYLMPDMSLPAIGALVRYIRRFTAAMGGDIPVEGRMGRYGFCAAGDSQQVRVYWVQVGRQRIPVDAVI